MLLLSSLLGCYAAEAPAEEACPSVEPDGVRRLESLGPEVLFGDRFDVLLVYRDDASFRAAWEEYQEESRGDAPEPPSVDFSTEQVVVVQWECSGCDMVCAEFGGFAEGDGGGLRALLDWCPGSGDNSCDFYQAYGAVWATPIAAVETCDPGACGG